MPPAIGDILRVTCKMSWAENDIQNVYHGQLDGTVAPDDVDLLDAIYDELDSAYTIIAGNIPAQVSFDTIAVYDLTQDYFIGESPWPVLETGGGGGSDPLPPQLAPLVLFGTAVLGSQGRKFLPPLEEGANDTDGTPVAVTLAALAQYAVDILAGVNETDYTVKFGNYRELTDTFIQWINAEVRDIWATQRRRYFGRGS